MVQNRKWKLARWGVGLGTIIAASAMLGWFFGFDGAPGILGQGLGLVSVVLGMYSAANVAQKRGKNNNNSMGSKNE